MPVRNAAYDEYDRSAYRIFDPSRGEKHRKQRSCDQPAVQADQPEIAPGPAEPELCPDKDIYQHELGKAAANGRDTENFEPDPVPSGKNDTEVCRTPYSIGKDTVVSLPLSQKNYAERPRKESSEGSRHLPLQNGRSGHELRRVQNFQYGRNEQQNAGDHRRADDQGDLSLFIGEPGHGGVVVAPFTQTREEIGQHSTRNQTRIYI